MTRAPAFHDIAHLGHVELLTPDFDASLAFFTEIVGLREVARHGRSVFLRAWGEYQLYSLKLTAAKTSGLGHMAFRASSEEALQRIVCALEADGTTGRWIEDEFGHGRAHRVPSPDGHEVEITTSTPASYPTRPRRPGSTSRARYVPHGIAPRRLDHLNMLARDVPACRAFFHELLGLRLTEQIIFDDGNEMGAWLSATNKSYDLAITHDRSGASGRLHHVTYMMDSREDVLRAADILRDADVPIETGPAQALHRTDVLPRTATSPAATASRSAPAAT